MTDSDHSDSYTSSDSEYVAAPEIQREAPREVFRATFIAFNVNVIDNRLKAQQVDRGNRVLLPLSALERLNELKAPCPMLFRMSNEMNGRSTHCGVLEFSADEGCCNLPQWLMRLLELEDGDRVEFQSVELPLGHYAKFQPQTPDFLDIVDPKPVLERNFGKLACISTGDMIDIEDNGKIYQVLVMETKPSEAIRIIDCDLESYFITPLGYEPPVIPLIDEFEAPIVEEDSEITQLTAGIELFAGLGNRLDGKSTETLQSSTAEITTGIRQRGVPDKKWQVGVTKFIRVRIPDEE